MIKNFVYACISCMFLFSCQSEEAIESTVEDKGVNLEALEQNPCEVTLISDEILSEENMPVQTRSYSTSVPIYRYYSNSGNDHYYGKEYSGTSRVINGYTYAYEVADFKIESQPVSSSIPLYRHYHSGNNDHRFSTSNVISGYSAGVLVGHIFRYPQLGTVPLKEYYRPDANEYFYVVRNSEVEYLEARNSAQYKGTLGYVYLGNKEWIDESKTANTIKLSKLQAIPCRVRMIVNAVEGNLNRRLTYEMFLPDYTNGWHGGFAEATLANTYTISSIELTITTYNKNNVGYTTSHTITSTEISPTATLKDNMTLGLSTSTTSNGAETSINFDYSNITADFY